MSSQHPAQDRLQLSQPYTFAPSSVPTRPGSPSLVSSRSDGSLTAEDHALLGTGEELAKRGQVISIDTLPDDALLEIFHHFINEFDKDFEEAWQLLVHVCRRWRRIVFESPRHLDLRLVCTGRAPARDMLDVWPALPLIIGCNPIRSVDNIIAALERSDRVCHIHFYDIRSSDMETLLPAMQHPFPELTRLTLWSDYPVSVIVPDSFLGGSAPRLQSLVLVGIPFPGLPKLLLSATHLVRLYLQDIPHSGYISPDTMATALSTLTSLDRLCLEFQYPRSCPDPASRRPPLKTRSVLPVLTSFYFRGVGNYLEDLVACIDAPRLDKLDIWFFNDTVFDTPQLDQFITRTPKSKAFEKARITFFHEAAQVDFSSQTSRYGDFKVSILCEGLELQVSSLAQVCTSCLPPFSMLEGLYFDDMLYSQPDWRGNIDNGLWPWLWLELLQPFTAVKNLYLTENVASRIVPALQELVEGRTTEVLPTLENIFLGGLESSGPVQEGIERFIAARQVAGHPIAVSSWTNPGMID